LIPPRSFPLDFLLLLRREKLSDSFPLVAQEVRTVCGGKSCDSEGGEEAVGEGEGAGEEGSGIVPIALAHNPNLENQPTD
jgi:hypothetical protein